MTVVRVSQIDRERFAHSWQDGDDVFALPDRGEPPSVVVGKIVATGHGADGFWADVELTPEATGQSGTIPDVEEDPFG